MALYEITTENITKIEQTTFNQAGLYERKDLQRLLRKQIEVVLPDVLVIAEEFGEWDDSHRRIDLLGLDRDANIVVIELKRTEDGGHMELQAIRYAAMVSTMKFERAVDVYAGYLSANGIEKDAEASILAFLGWGDANEGVFGNDIKIVLVSSNFSKELTTAVMWLNDRDLDIRCIRLVPHDDNGRILLDIQQIIPLPEAAEYQVKIREKEQLERKARAQGNQLIVQFWESFRSHGGPGIPFYDKIKPSDRSFIGAPSGVSGLVYYYVIAQYRTRIELYIDTGDLIENKRIFDELFEKKHEIESSFGGPLSWQRLEEKRGSRIACLLELGGYRSDELDWPEIHDQMIDSMRRLEQALSTHLSKVVHRR